MRGARGKLALLAAIAAGGCDDRVPCSSNPAPVFTAHLTSPLDQVFEITPLGGAADRAERSYIHPEAAFIAGGGKMAIYAPADVRLVRLAYYVHPSSGREMYALRFEVSCEVVFTLAHVIELSERIAALAPSHPRTTSEQYDVGPLDLAAGELIGYTDEASWDFLASNTAATNEFANTARYQRAHAELYHAVCPYDLFSPALRQPYYDLLPGGSCGSVSADVPGTIAGQWFVNPAPPSSGFDELGVYVAAQLQTGGNSRVEVVFGTEAGERHVYPEQATFLDPATVSDAHCYAFGEPGVPETFAFFQLASETELQVASGTGGCPASLPDDFAVYYR